MNIEAPRTEKRRQERLWGKKRPPAGHPKKPRQRKNQNLQNMKLQNVWGGVWYRQPGCGEGETDLNTERS